MRKIINLIKKGCFFAILFILFTFGYFLQNVSASNILIDRKNSDYIEDVKTQTYKKDDVVDLIVELNDKPLIDNYDLSKYDSFQEFMKSKNNEDFKNYLLSKQNNVIQTIKNQNIVVDLSNSYNYTVVTNAISLRTKVSNMKAIYDIEGVKDVYISNTYEPLKYDVTNETFGLGDQIIYTDNLMNSQTANADGYTGKGTAVAVIDTGMDLKHVGFTGEVDSPRYTKDYLDQYLKTVELTAKGVTSASMIYYSDKIPYSFDYADNDTDVYNIENTHGAHVAGIVGANNGATRGVAPDAQIFAMKVFGSSGGAMDTYVLAALEDCLKLGVDVVNMSLGSACGSSYVTGKVQEIYDQVREKGINLYVAAGNDSYVGIENQSETNLPLAASPDYGLVASPSTYVPSISVASIDNPTYITNLIKATDDYSFSYADAARSADTLINTALNGKVLPLVEVPGVGKESDYEGIDVKDKVVLIKRGTISFSEKHDTAKSKGALAMIVYNPENDTMVNMQIDNLQIPSVFISLMTYNKLIELDVKELTFDENNLGGVPNSSGGMVSFYSSRGTTPDLEIKPEIAGPGGFIYSTTYNDSYEQYSGTSMACPNVAGAAALVKQYINENYSQLSKAEKFDRINTLLMETAKPVKNEEGCFDLVRAQGSGLVDVNAAISVKALVSVKDQVRPKAELGSSLSGSFSYTFKIENQKNEAITYSLDNATLTDQSKEIDGIYYSTVQSRQLSSEEVKISYSDNVIDNSITVAAKATIEVTIYIKVLDAFKNAQKDIFTNGSFVEGYTFLNTTTDECLVIPYLGFYGDFDSLPLIEGSPYTDDESTYNMSASFACGFDGTGSGYELGFDTVSEKFYKNRIYFSNSNLKDNVITSYTGLFRNIDYAKFEVIDSNGEVVFEEQDTNFRKSFYYANGDFVTGCYVYPGWDGVKKDGTKATDGEKFTFKTVVGKYKKDHQTIAKEETWSFDFIIDSLIPELDDYKIIEEDCIKYLQITASDNYQVANITINDLGLNYELAEPFVYLDDAHTCVGKFKLDDILSIINENELNNSQVKIGITDWASNFIYKTITIGPSLIKLDDSYNIAVNGTKQLKPTIVPTLLGIDDLTFSSSDERIATVDKDGNVKGVSSGVATITISGANGVYATTRVNIGGSIDSSIEIIGGNKEMEIGDSASLRVNLLPLDVVDTTVEWKSSNEKVATITENGIIDALAIGTTTITAKSAGGNVDTIEVNVIGKKIESISLFSTKKTVLIGETMKIEMISIYPQTAGFESVVFSSSDESILKVNNDGTCTGVSDGQAKFIVSSQDGSVSASIDITVIPIQPVNILINNNLVIDNHETYQLKPEVMPLNTTYKNLQYISNDESIAEVDEKGILTAKKVGNTFITINCGSVSKVVYITVCPIQVQELSSSESLVPMNTGDVKQLDIKCYPLDATYQNYIWYTSNASIAKVVDGTVTAYTPGTAIITAEAVNGVKIEYYIIVTNKTEEFTPSYNFNDIVLTKGDKFDLEFNQKELDNYKLIVADDSVAIESNGKLYGISEGTTNISVLVNNEVISTFKVTVAKKGNCNSNAAFIISSFISISLLSFVLLKRNK